MKAMWNKVIIAQSDDIVTVDGNAYFPRESLNEKWVESSDKTSVCPWKGTANYFSLNVDGMKNTDAAWFYAEPFEAASHIKDRIAFWKGVEVIDE